MVAASNVCFTGWLRSEGTMGARALGSWIAACALIATACGGDDDAGGVSGMGPQSGGAGGVPGMMAGTSGGMGQPLAGMTGGAGSMAGAGGMMSVAGMGSGGAGGLGGAAGMLMAGAGGGEAPGPCMPAPSGVSAAAAEA